MSRSREFGPTIFERFEQGRQARDAMIQRALTVRTLPPVNYVSSSVSIGPSRSGSRLLLATIGITGLAMGLNFVDGFSIADAKQIDTPTPARTSSPTPTPTRTPSSVSRATVVTSGDRERIQIDASNTNTNSNDNSISLSIIQRLLDALLNRSDQDRAKPADTPRPSDTPTPKPFQDIIELNKARSELYGSSAVAEGMRLDDEIAKKRVNDFLNPTATPNATETRQAKETAFTEKVANDKTATAVAAPPAVAAAKRRAEQLGKEEEVAELEAENRRTEERIRRLRGESLPTPTPAGAGSTGRSGEFPWLPLILVTGGLGAIYLSRGRIFPAPTGAPLVVGGPAVPTNIWQRIYVLRGPRI